mmetsp:Transcript_60889/g.188825  ORF Transcript_60889/g.188825 Transcript_60889/m.188825 type:complete len:213 (+) Transcript_60889:406-1044(+)
MTSSETSASTNSTRRCTGALNASSAPRAGAQADDRCFASACAGSGAAPNFARRFARLARRSSTASASPTNGSTSVSQRSKSSSRMWPMDWASWSFDAGCPPEKSTCRRILAAIGANKILCTRPRTLVRRPPSAQSESAVVLRPNQPLSASAWQLKTSSSAFSRRASRAHHWSSAPRRAWRIWLWHAWHSSTSSMLQKRTTVPAPISQTTRAD